MSQCDGLVSSFVCCLENGRGVMGNMVSSLARERHPKVTAVGFEPTQLALVELESTPLDHSGKVSVMRLLCCQCRRQNRPGKERNIIGAGGTGR